MMKILKINFFHSIKSCHWKVKMNFDIEIHQKKVKKIEETLQGKKLNVVPGKTYFLWIIAFLLIAKRKT